MKNKLLAMIGAAALVLATAGAAVATNYSLWINGRNNPGVQGGNYADFTYWGPAATAGQNAPVRLRLWPVRASRYPPSQPRQSHPAWPA